MTTSLRIGLISLAFRPAAMTPFPGVNRYAVSLAEALVRNGCTVKVVTPLLGAAAPRESWRGIEIIRLRDSKTVLGRLGALGELNFRSFEVNLLRHLRVLEDCDVLHTDLPLPRLRPHWKWKPIVAIVHHVYRAWSGLDILTAPFGVMYQRNFLKRADVVVTPTNSAAAETIREYRVPRDKVRVIHHGVDTILFHPVRLAIHRPHDLRRILYVGLLEPRKGVDDLIPIFQRVSETSPTSILEVVGFGPKEGEMKEACERLCLSGRVTFQRNLSDQELSSLVGSCDVFVFPSRLEGFGLAVAEAMACARPVVAYDNPTNREVIGDGGILVPEGDVGAFSRAVIDLVQHPDLSVRLGEKGQERVAKQFHWDTTARQYIDLDKQVLRKYLT